MPPQDPLLATDSVLRCLVTAISSWLIVGALGYGHWSPPDNGIPLDMLVGVVLVMAQVVPLLVAVDAAGATWPRSFGAYATSAILGFGVTTASAILLSKFAQHAYLGVAAEGLAGLVHRARAALAGTAESQVVEVKRN